MEILNTESCERIKNWFPTFSKAIGEDGFNNILIEFDKFLSNGSNVLQHLTIDNIMSDEFLVRSMFMSFAAGYLEGSKEKDNRVIH